MSELVVLFLVVALAVGFLAAFRSRQSSAGAKGRDGERRVAQLISSLGFPALHDVYLPSDNGTTQIDHIVRVGNCIVVIETKNFGGMLYGGAHDPSWRQSFRRKDSSSFFNPLKQNAIHVKSVAKIAGTGADIRQLVVMAGSSRFPNGAPDGVVGLIDLKQWLRFAFVDAGKYGTVKEPWERLIRAAKKGNTPRSRADHAETVRRATSQQSGRASDGARIDPIFINDGSGG
jgi:hypothetical protein|nr:nuclease-related domain-containing protein [Neorhizobium tomejilense]